MSEPDETAPHDAMPLLDVPETEPIANPQLVAPPSAPYRDPAPIILEEQPPAAPSRRPRTVLGPALSVFAVLLWGFVVAGQYTTSWMLGAPIAPGTALMFIVLTTVAAGIVGLRGSQRAAPASGLRMFWRAVRIAALASLFFLVCLVAAAVAGAASAQSHDFLIPFALVVLALLAAIAGPRVTSPVPIARFHPQAVRLVALWIAAVLLTLVAGADLATNG